MANVGQLLLAIWLILVGLAWLGWITISAKFLGGWALVTGIVLLLYGFGVVNWAPWPRKPVA